MTTRPEPRRGSRLVAGLLYGGTAAAALVAPRLRRAVVRRLPATSPPALAEAVADSVVGAALVAGGWATIAAAERLRPFDPDGNRPRGDVAADAWSLVVGGGLSQLVGGLLDARLRRAVGDRSLAGPLARLPLAARVAVTVSTYDLVHVAHHRLGHETAYWRVHSVHHSAPRLYWFNATRFHVVELVVDTVLEQTMLALLGADAETRLAHRVLRGIFGQIQHGNVDLDSGPATAVLSTPERHRWHHSTDPAEGNSNYGAVVAVWDRLGGTDVVPDRPFDAEVGNGMPAFPTGWLGQTLAPVRWAAASAPPAEAPRPTPAPNTTTVPEEG